MSKWQSCPVCGGRGIVPQGFYTYPEGQDFSSTSALPEECRTCVGAGIILEFEDMEFPEDCNGENPCDI